MISVDDALVLLNWQDTFVGNSHGLASLRNMSNWQAEQIAELIKHLQSNCNLEVNELLEGEQGDISGN